MQSKAYWASFIVYSVSLKPTKQGLWCTVYSLKPTEQDLQCTLSSLKPTEQGL